MKLWQKDNVSTNELIEKFTVGRDSEFDLLLARYDVQGSIAHVKMLKAVGLMNEKDAADAVRGLEDILKDILDSKFIIEESLRLGLIHKGSLIVESTSGNMGVGLAQVCLYYGLKLRLVVDPY
ncbi:MAG TPA: hypothetical protein PLR74_01680, partial [Agriterribacter sp.]|nr:hypothetical protein [Agriterribacter sp.]